MKPISTPKGMRDFSPAVMAGRQFILDTLKGVFQKYGFQHLETPAMENLSTLMGKYGDEGDQLLFKILNSGNYLRNVDTGSRTEENIKKFTTEIADKGLRYDLTVPLARYVTMNRHRLTFPFRRFQMQPVWRADRPQRGRYREFYQCDADVVGTRSLLCEAEMMMMVVKVCQKLGIRNYNIKINHRGILSGLAETAGSSTKDFLFSALDKWHKVGKEKVQEELQEKGVGQAGLKNLFELLEMKGSHSEKLKKLASKLERSEQAKKGIEELEELLLLLSKFRVPDEVIKLDMVLARGLSYYTGTIFEVVIEHTSIGSISGGGRYDHLTRIFGLPDVSGVGISFGVDRIYDVMEELNLFSSQKGSPSKVLIAHLDTESMYYGINVLEAIRKAGIAAEIYPDHNKLKKQLEYAHKNEIEFVVVIGDEEVSTEKLTLKNMKKGSQQKLGIGEVIEQIRHGGNAASAS